MSDTKREPVYYGLQGVTMGFDCNKAQLWWGMWTIRAAMYAYTQEQILDEKPLTLQLNSVMHLKLLEIKFIKKN